ncbi:MAG: prephenate dehydrogenase [Burkholderiales bacterium]
MTFRINKLAVFGVGLIGGSFAMALRQAGVVGEVVGVGRGRENLELALRLGVVDAIAEPEDAVRGADLVMLAVPVGQMGGVMARIAARLEAGAVVTDAGSTKQDVVEIAQTSLQSSLDRFVPGHPIAGAELSGVAAASADLFQGKQVVLTPCTQTSADALLRVRQAWQACGAQVAEMSPAEHDRVFAAVSHLPHLLAFALVDDIAGKANAGQLFGYAASGFRDFTRIAGSHPEMWRDICLANRVALLGELDAYREQLERLHTALEQGDGAALERVFARASAARNAWAANKKNA